MKAKTSSIFIFCLLAISLLTIASNDALAMNNENTKADQKNSLLDQASAVSQNSKSTRQIEIDLTDGVSVIQMIRKTRDIKMFNMPNQLYINKLT